MNRYVLALAMIMVMLASSAPAQARSKHNVGRLILTATNQTLPPKLKRKYNYSCASMQVRDNNTDGVVEYRFAWNSRAWDRGYFTTDAHWDGSQFITERPMPLIAHLAIYGAEGPPPKAQSVGIFDHLRLPDSFDRTICALDTRWIGRVATPRPIAVRKAKRVYRKRHMRYTHRLLPVFNAADNADITSTLQARKDALDAWIAKAEADAAAARQAWLEEQYQKYVAGFTKTCPPGTLVGGKPCIMKTRCEFMVEMCAIPADVYRDERK